MTVKMPVIHLYFSPSIRRKEFFAGGQVSETRAISFGFLLYSSSPEAVNVKKVAFKYSAAFAHILLISASPVTRVKASTWQVDSPPIGLPFENYFFSKEAYEKFSLTGWLA